MFRKDSFVPGEYYHIYNRGIDKRIIFKSVHDYRRFMMLLYVANSDQPIKLDNFLNILHKSYQEVFSCERGKQLVSIGAWGTMPNHFHILVKEEMEGGITKFMRKLGVAYSMYFNIKYQRQGALFGGLFKSRLIDADDIYLKHLFAYINLNPLNLKFFDWENRTKIKNSSSEMRSFLEKYPYSSYLDLLGRERAEGRILLLKDFPNYFEETDSFK